MRRSIGFMPDHFSMYRQMTVHEYLDFFGAAYGQPPSRRATVISDVLALTDMESRQHDVIQGLSRGMQQRVSLARVLINDPKLLLLDEPAGGVNLTMLGDLKERLQAYNRDHGTTFVVIEHNMEFVMSLCTRIIVLAEGAIIAEGPPDQIRNNQTVIDAYLGG